MNDYHYLRCGIWVRNSRCLDLIGKITKVLSVGGYHLGRKERKKRLVTLHFANICPQTSGYKNCHVFLTSPRRVDVHLPFTWHQSLPTDQWIPNCHVFVTHGLASSTGTASGADKLRSFKPPPAMNDGKHTCLVRSYLPLCFLYWCLCSPPGLFTKPWEKSPTTNADVSECPLISYCDVTQEGKWQSCDWLSWHECQRVCIGLNLLIVL